MERNGQRNRSPAWNTNFGIDGVGSKNKNNPDKSTSIINEMEIDINRLTEISDRFSKIGSSINLTEVNLSQAVKENIKYLKKRYSFNDDSLEIFIRKRLLLLLAIIP